MENDEKTGLQTSSVNAGPDWGSEWIFCPVCGEQIPAKGAFCMHCGSNIQEFRVPGTNSGVASAQPQAQQGYPQAQQGYPQVQQGYGHVQQGYNPPPKYFNPSDPRLKQFQTTTLNSEQQELVRCTNLNKSYGMQSAIYDLNLAIGSGRIIGLLGPNGSGKTTLIKLICGLLTPTAGTISVCGMPIGPSTKALVSYLPDRSYIPDWMTIRDIIEYFSDFYADFRAPLAETMLANMNIRLDARMKTLSKGNQEKVQLVLVMSRNAKLYLLDEPIAGVDPVARDYILDTILRMHNPESSVLLSTHLITDIEPVLDEAIMIKCGTLVLQGEANQLRSKFGKSLNDIFKEVFAGC